MMYLPFPNQTSFGNVTNLSYLMWYLLTAPPFMMPRKHNHPIIYSVVNQSTILSCNVSISDLENNVRLILWYKNDSKTPFYTIDSRKSTIAKAKHFISSELDKRVSMNLGKTPLELRLESVQTSDENIYRCRVELSSAPTESFAVQLKVIVPPLKVKILSGLEEVENAIVGPFDEGSNATLTCVSLGGTPLPIVTWWHESSLVDKSYFAMSGTEVMNELQMFNLQREDLYKRYTCLASNTNLTLPLSASVSIDMNLKPVGVKIITEENPLYSGKKMVSTCETWGSKPPSLLSWWLNGEKLHLGNDIFTNNVTRSTITFVPNPGQNGKTLLCKAEQPGFPENNIEYGWILLVFYKPLLKVTLGRKLDPENVVEGIDIYLECHADSNPRIEEVHWFFGRQQLYSNISAGIIVSNQSLALRSLQRIQSGRYQCHAENSIGGTWSEPFNLRVKYVPSCRYSPGRIFSSSGSTITVYCEVNSDPVIEIFYWSLTRKGLTIELPSSNNNFIELNSSQDLDVIKCWGKNTIGNQPQPCEITVVKKDVRKLINGCDIKKLNDTMLQIVCENPYFEKDVPTFHLEVYDPSLNLISNISSAVYPRFLVENLQTSNVSFLLYASSLSGYTECLNLTFTSTHQSQHLNATRNHLMIGSNSNGNAENMTWMTIVLICVLVICIPIGISATILLKKKSEKRKQCSDQNKSDNESVNGESEKLDAQAATAKLCHKNDEKRSHFQDRDVEENIELMCNQRNNICDKAL